MQVSKQDISDRIANRIFKSLYQVLADLKQPQAVEKFFGAILSPTERLVLAKRLAIAGYLKKNKSYEVIKNELKVSSVSIARVRSLLEQDREGLTLALKTIEADEWAEDLVNKISTAFKKLLK